MASSKPSFPAPSEPNLKRLGVGGGGSDRPIKAQLVVFSVLLLLLVAIPLYLLRRPAADTQPQPAPGKTADPGLIRSQQDAGKPKLKVELGELQRVQCSSSPAKKGNEGPLCDGLPRIERVFKEAIRANASCAPRTGKSGTINFVLSVDFQSKKLNVFPGASGQWKGPQAKAAAECVENALPEIKWEETPHRYRYYMLAIMATYPAPDPSEGFPTFE